MLCIASPSQKTFGGGLRFVFKASVLSLGFALFSCGRIDSKEISTLQKSAQVQVGFESWCQTQDADAKKTVLALVRFVQKENCEKASQAIEKIAELDLQNQGLTNIEPLKNLRNLTFLNLAGNQVKDFSHLAAIPNLKTLWISKNPILSVQSLPVLPSVTDLSVSSIGLKSLAGIQQNFPKLEFLYADNNSIVDLSPLSGVKSLFKLQLNFNQIQDLGPLSGLGMSLRLLEFTGNQVKDLSPLKNLRKLNYVIGGKNKVRDLQPLADMTDLEAIGLWANEIESIEALSSVPNLLVLSLGGNKIKDFLPIQKLKKIDQFDARSNPVDPALCPTNALSVAVQKFCESL